MEIVLSNRIYLINAEKIKKTLKQKLEMPNPKYFEAIRAGRQHRFIDKTITLFKEHVEPENCYSIPRGCENMLCEILDQNNIDIMFTDETTKQELANNTEFCVSGTTDSLVDYECNIKPYLYQFPAIESVLNNDSGVLCLGTGAGKTVAALYCIAQRQQNTFILVPTKTLMYQWQSAIKKFLNCDCGLVGDNKFKLRSITVGLPRTVINKSKEYRFGDAFGYFIVDEAHRCPSSTFTEAVECFSAYYITALTATPTRRDGLQNFIFWCLGDLIYEMDKKDLVLEGKIIKPDVVVHKTKLSHAKNPETGKLVANYQELITNLKLSEERNKMIASDVCERYFESEENCLLILSDHTEHLELISEQLNKLDIPHKILHGGLNTQTQQDIVKQLTNGGDTGIDVCLATAGLMSEGVDIDRFTDLFLTMPISYEGRLIQIVGRLVRSKKGKKNVFIHDYVDKEDIFNHQFSKRLKVYNSY